MGFPSRGCWGGKEWEGEKTGLHFQTSLAPAAIIPNATEKMNPVFKYASLVQDAKSCQSITGVTSLSMKNLRDFYERLCNQA